MATKTTGTTGTSGLAKAIIEGAGDAVKGGNPVNLSMFDAQGEALNKIGAGIGNLGLAAIQKAQEEKEAEELRRQEELKKLDQFNKLAGEALHDSEYITDGERDYITQKLIDGNNAIYESDDPNTATTLMEKQQFMVDEIVSLKGFRDDLALNGTNPDGMRDAFKQSELGQDFSRIFSGETEMTENEKGKFGYMVYNPNVQVERKQMLDKINLEINSLSVDESGNEILDLHKKRQQLEDEIFLSEADPSMDKTWHSVHDLKNIMTHNSFDRDYSDQLVKFRDQSIQMAEGVAQGRPHGFRDNVMYSQLKNNFVKKCNKRSLMEDEGWGEIDGNFTGNLEDAIFRGATYEDFGIEYSQVKSMDPTGVDINKDGLDDQTGKPMRITKDDAIIIARELKSSDMIDDYLTAYLLSHIKNNYIGAWEASRSADPNNDEKEFINM